MEIEAIKVPKALCDKNFTYAELKTLLYYFAYAEGGTLTCEEIAKKIKLSKRHMINVRGELVEAGYLKKGDRKGNGIVHYKPIWF